MTAYISVRCDGCGSGYNDPAGRHVSPQSLRHWLRGRGWHVRRKTGEATRDVCPDCWKAGVR